MYIDKELLFDDAAAHTSTGNGTDIIDLRAYNMDSGGDGEAAPHGTADQTIGQGKMYLVVIVDAAADAATSVVIDLRSCDNSNMTTTPQIHATQTFSAPATDLAIGTKHIIGTFDGPINERYLGVRYTVTGASTVGTYTAFLTHNVDQGHPLS